MKRAATVTVALLGIALVAEGVGGMFTLIALWRGWIPDSAPWSFRLLISALIGLVYLGIVLLVILFVSVGSKPPKNK